jgi:hypothetical protein
MKNIILIVLLCACHWVAKGQDDKTISQGNSSSNITTPNNKVCLSSCCFDRGAQAPLGIMTDHIHDKGKWMLSYMFMNSTMQGNRSGTKSLSDMDVSQTYMMVPETMTMQMHMVMLMYGVTNRLTLMAMGSYMSMNMNMNMIMNSNTNMKGMNTTPGDTTMQCTSSGISDTKLTALYNFSKKSTNRFILSFGFSLPTGAINSNGTTIMGVNQRLPYGMQLGSGSYSLIPDISYTKNYGDFYWGANAGADVKLNFNSLGYKQGNSYHANAWLGYQKFRNLAFTLRAEDIRTDQIAGYDPLMANPIYLNNDPSTRTSNYGGNWVNMYLGVNLHLSKPIVEKFRLLAEYGLPIYQNLNGTQMSTKTNLLVGVRYAL